MKVGYYLSTPQSRLMELIRIHASLAMYDALKYGPVCFSRLS